MRCFRGESYGSWQVPHLVPPLIRFLRTIEHDFDSSWNWELHGVTDPFHPVTSECSVTVESARIDHLRPICEEVIRREVMFSIVSADRNSVRLRHSMGWSVRIDSQPVTSNACSASILAQRLDPLSVEPSTRFQSDLHLHTSWSDGAASIASMANAASQNGLGYIAITDHSRSCKLQRADSN